MGRFDTLFALLGLVASVAVLATAARLEPDRRGHGTHEQLGIPPCDFLLRTGRPCISCGMTTAFAAMAHGRVGAALAANPYGAALFLVVLAAPWWCVRSLRRRMSPLAFAETPRGRRALLLAGLLLFVNWGWMLLRPPPG